MIIAITQGDPSGIGPEVALKALATLRHNPVDGARLILVGHRPGIDRTARSMGVLPKTLQLRPIDKPEEAPALPEVGFYSPADTDVPLEAMPWGEVTADGGRVSGRAIETAIDWALAKRIDGIVTAPIHKAATHAAGWSYPGHTEWLARRAETDTVMCMVGGGVICGFVTTHIALRDVPAAVTRDKIILAGERVAEALPRLTISRQPLAVLGLNPHASDEGRFGDEEQRVIAPAVTALRAAGIAAEGPVVPDAAFRLHLSGRYSGVLALYHDQGNIVFKTLAFDEGVNVTLGLPFVRTSPDHGTAFDLAGKNRASATSMLAALKLALQLAGECVGYGT
jgi:4-hydroxythreonine-4-phosphate dehydrogenase